MLRVVCLFFLMNVFHEARTEVLGGEYRYKYRSRVRVVNKF